MFHNDFSIRIQEGDETPGGYVELVHNTTYSLILGNKRNLRCDARVEIDGKEVGKWRIGAHETIRLERPANDTGRFTFYKVETSEARAAQLSEGSPDLGLVKVTFTPEKYIKPVRPVVTSVTYRDTFSKGYVTEDSFDNRPFPAGMASASIGDYDDEPATRSFNMANTQSAGGTGLSGKSNQNFYTVAELDYDYSQETVIHLRLVAKNGNEPRPLVSRETPVPPPV